MGNQSPTRERWQPPGSQPWRVVRNGGLKRRQRAQKPCDRASKYPIAGVFAFMPAGAAPERPRPGARVRPGSESRANVRKGSLGTWESLRSPPPIGQTKDGTGLPTSRHPRGSLAARVSERAKHEGVSRAERNEASETDQGSRSVFIVCAEQRVVQEGSSPSGARMRGAVSNKRG